jgi:superfamily II helicase
MVKNWYVREIILILKDPRLCPTCEKDDKFEINVVRENVSRGKTFLCTRCEALTIVTHLNLRRVELSSQIGDNIMLKEPHPIRKVSY